MEADLNIVIIEADASISTVLEEKLEQLGFSRCHAVAPHSPVHQLKSLKPGLGIVGASLGTRTCLESIHKLKIVDPAMPILTTCDDALSSELFAIGPYDRIHYLNREMDVNELSKLIQTALEDRSDDRQRLDSSIQLMGQNQAIKDIREKIQRISPKDVTVLITGETGTGKELIARSIHYHSLRSNKPLIKISCGVLPDDLLESEVFGFQRGAFTGAHQDKPGRLEMATGGTLFIDEIGDLSPPLQAKFLQVLEEKVFARLGGVKDKVIDARVIAATHWDLAQKVREGAFRKDLFYRLNAVHINALPLRERRDDISLLTRYFIHKYCFELQTELLAIPDDVVALFLAYHWPGNVRELENIIRRAIVLRDWRFVFGELNVEDLQQGVHDAPPGAALTHRDWHDEKIIESFSTGDFSLRKVSKAYVSQVERDAIRDALKRTGWNRKKAAQLLQVSYKTLLNRIDEYGLKP